MTTQRTHRHVASRGSLLGPVSLALVVALGALTTAHGQQGTGLPPPLQPSVPEPANPVHDAAITASVNAALARDGALAATLIDVETVNGHVNLKGRAPDPDARERASRIAAAIPGVVSVENQLAIGRPTLNAPVRTP